MSDDASGIVSKRSSMTLFSDNTSHYSHRVRLVLAEKGVTVELLESESGAVPAELGDLNPYNTMPTLVDRELVLYESKIFSPTDKRIDPRVEMMLPINLNQYKYQLLFVVYENQDAILYNVPSMEIVHKISFQPSYDVKVSLK